MPTPSLVLDRVKLERNLARLEKISTRRGVRLRPHLKTAKCIEIARLVSPDGAMPLTVSTLREAEFFHAHGYSDLFYAVGLGPGKIERAAALIAQGANLITMVDGLTAAEAVAAAARQRGLLFRTVVEIDCGEHRAGLAPDSMSLLPVARALGKNFAGVATHSGHSYAAFTAAQLATVAAQEVEAIRDAAGRLAAAGLPCAIVSIGSSPTAHAGPALKGVTEVRAGVYMFWDLLQAGLGCCAVEDIALTVLAEVIGRPEGRDAFLIDAGAFALSKDRSTDALPEPSRADYGWICDLEGNHLPGLRVARVWQEHGLVVSDQPLPPVAFPVGTRVRVLPNHACATAAAHDCYHVVDGGQTVAATWSRCNGW